MSEKKRYVLIADQKCMAFYIPFLTVGHVKEGSPLSAIFTFASTILIIGIFVYLYIAMQRFYKQEWYKTTIKFLLQGAFFIIVICTFTIALFLNSMLSLAAGGH